MIEKRATVVFLVELIIATALYTAVIIFTAKAGSTNTINDLKQQVRELSEKTCPIPTEEDCRRVYGVKLPENIKLSDKDTFIDPDGEQLPEVDTVGMYKGRKCTVVKPYTDTPHCVMCVGETRVRVYKPGTGDPFSSERNNPVRIKIIDLKEGWAKFSYHGGSNGMKGEQDTIQAAALCYNFEKVEN